MLKVMIVDDEAIFRDYLRAVIDWEALGFTICSEAKHGVEALECVEQQKPDIALIDITMPFMNGLQLAEQLCNKYPSISIVLITGHNEFEYARTALKIGVNDYILKPFSKDELLLTLVKLQQKHQKAYEERLTMHENNALLKENLFNKLIQRDNDRSKTEVVKKLNQFGVVFHKPLFVVACIEIDQMDLKWSSASERALMKYAVTNILDESLEESRNHYIFNGPEGRIICLTEHYGQHVNESTDLEGFKKLCMLIKKYLKFTVTIGVGRSKQDIEGIALSYLEALEALQAKFIYGYDRVLPYNTELDKQVNGAYYPTDINDELLIQLRRHDWIRVEQKLDEIFEMIVVKKLSMDYVYVICMGLISITLSYITESGHPIEDCFGESFYPYSEIKSFDTSEQTFVWLKQLFKKTIDYTSKHKNTRSSKIAKSAKEYIEKNYMNPNLQLEHIAQHVFINASYLRAVFKKEIGITVFDYIMQCRMLKAKELLVGNAYRMSDIAEAVGYSDPSYFSKSFKKYFGYSPSEYENSRQTKL